MACFANMTDEAMILVTPLVDEMLYMESQLEHLHSVPFLVADPKNPARQRQTPAAQLYSRLINRYTDIVVRLIRMLYHGEAEVESPLRAYLKTLEDG